MQAGTEEKTKDRIELKSSAEDCHVAGFCDQYAAYLEGPDGDAVYNGRLLMGLGFIIVAVGVAILIFGPSVIYYDRRVGLSFFQHVQLNPGLIIIAGSVCVAWSRKLLSKRPMSRESYLQAHYLLIGADGRDVSSEIQVRHLRDDRFHVSVEPSLT